MDDLFEEELQDVKDEAGNYIEKVCSCCGKLKPIESFYRNGTGPSGKPRYRRDCKACYNEANKGRTQAYRDRKWEEKYGEGAFEDPGYTVITL